MTLDPIAEARVLASVNAVEQAASAVTRAPDLAAMKAALNKVWFAVHEAQNTINIADSMTRKSALLKLEEMA